MFSSYICSKLGFYFKITSFEFFNLLLSTINTLTDQSSISRSSLIDEISHISSLSINETESEKLVRTIVKEISITF